MSSYRFEDVLRMIGVGPRWHCVIFLITSMPSLFGGLHNMGSIFLLYTPDHWCSPGSPTDLAEAARNNWTLEMIKDYAIPRIAPQSQSFSKCDIYVRNYSAVFSTPWSEDVFNGSFVGVRSKKCSSWMYDTSSVLSSVVTQWDLVCDHKAYASIGKSAYMIGMFFGSAGFGYLSDRYGRRRIALLALSQYVISALLATFAPTYPLYVLLRMLTGMAAIGFFMCSYVVLSETILPQHRGLLQNLNNVGFALGVMILPLIVYLFSAWRKFYLVITLLSFSNCSFYWLFPESPRWLILQGRKEEARVVLRRIANISGRCQLSDDRLMKIISKCHDHMKSQESNKATEKQRSLLVNLVRTWEMRKITLICCYMWASVTCAYYGISFASPKLGSNALLMAFFMGVCELPSGPIGAFIVRFVSRKSSICGSLFLTGIFCFIYSALPKDYGWLEPTVVLSGRSAVAVAFCVLYVMTSELFPTDHRNIAMGVNSTCARVGAVIAAFTVDFLSAYYAMVIFGVAMIVAAGLCFLLHETGNKSLPETEVDVQNFDELEIKEGLTQVDKEETNC